MLLLHQCRACREGGSKIDEFNNAMGIDHYIGRFQIEVQNIFAVHGTQAQNDLFHNRAHFFEIGLGIVQHPLLQCFTFEILRWRFKRHDFCGVVVFGKIDLSSASFADGPDGFFDGVIFDHDDINGYIQKLSSNAALHND